VTTNCELYWSVSAKDPLRNCCRKGDKFLQYSPAGRRVKSDFFPNIRGRPSEVILSFSVTTTASNLTWRYNCTP
jgi:hypothetical protein